MLHCVGNSVWQRHTSVLNLIRVLSVSAPFTAFTALYSQFERGLKSVSKQNPLLFTATKIGNYECVSSFL